MVKNTERKQQIDYKKRFDEKLDHRKMQGTVGRNDFGISS